MTVGENIKRIRINKGWTQKQLGAACDPKMNEANIRKYENGNAEPGFKVLKRISTALGVNLYELLDQEQIELDIHDKEKILMGLRRYKNGNIESITEPNLDEKKHNFINKMFYFKQLLNETGQTKAIEQVEMLTKIPEYRKED